jgi:eukaryotic-like serine/threonine-protein kinase
VGLHSSLDDQRRSCLIIFSSLFLIFVMIGGGGFALFHFSIIHFPSFGNHPSTPTATIQTGNGIGVSKNSNGELIGLSDGRYAFDTGRSDGTLKTQAATALQQGEASSAESLWQQALNLPNESNDAETLIYLEDQQVLASHQPYITLVVGTILTGGTDDLGTGRDDLQGAYVAQKLYNDGFKLSGNTLVRLLVANAGSNSTDAASVAQQIVQAAKKDSTIIGVLGWPYSGHSLSAVKVLGLAHIPMVSQTASSDALTNISPFFFRVAPSNNIQAVAGAHYAEQQLHVTKAALFVDPTNSYSTSLAKDFQNQFTADGNQVVVTENYTVGKPGTLPASLQDAVSKGADLVYFAGYAADMGVLLTDLGTSDPGLKVMGGDALYQIQGYPSSARPAFNRLHFTAFAHPNEWDQLGYGAQKPTFFTTYAFDFDPNKDRPYAYGYGRPDNDVILSYDAMLALLQGVNTALGEKNNPTPTMVQQGLQDITEAQAIQGVSGQIAFGPDGNPVNKAVIVLYVDPNDFIQIAQVEGCFLVSQLAGNGCQ